MKKNKFVLFTFILSALFLSACTGAAGNLNGTSWPGVTAAEDFVYLANGPFIYALNVADGSQQWQYPNEADNDISFYASPALTEDGSNLFTGAYDGVLYKLNTSNGRPVGTPFEEATNRYISDVVLANEHVYAANSDGNLFALDFSLNTLWDEPFSIDKPIWASPVSDGTTLFVAALDNKVHALDLETGKQIWAQDLETAINGTPTIANGQLYVGTFGSKVYSLDTDSGKILWQFETQDWVWSSPTVDNGTVFIGDVGGTMYALDANSGAQVWSYNAEGGIYGGALVNDGVLYFGTEAGRIYALTTEGVVEWTQEFTGKIYAKPAFNGEYLFVTTLEGDTLLTALGLNGVTRWSFTPES